MTATSDRLQEFFLKAARATYAANQGGTVRKGTLPGLPKSKVYQYRQDDLLYVDTYFTNGDLSGGQTVIWLTENPVWISQYQGWCAGDDKVVLDFLKRALLNAYATNEFIGGRGRREYSDAEVSHQYGRLTYRNDYLGSFEQGSGGEYIVAGGNLRVFWHRYQHLLLDVM